MRCQKVRSFLSAYCRGELPERRSRAIMEHLDSCPKCRYEEAAYMEMNSTMAKLPAYTVSKDFNSRLLKRISEERFKETRTKAYLPKKIPVVTFNRLAPVLAAACFIFAFIFSGGVEKLLEGDEPAVIVSTELDDSYMSMQPEPGHVLSQHLTADWAFKKEVARAARIRGLMNRLSNQDYFGSLASQSTSRDIQRSIFFRQPVRPVFRKYNSPESIFVRGVNSSN